MRFSDSAQDSVVPWAPPQTNWNAWTASNIDEGYLSTASLEDLCTDLENAARDKRDNCPEYQVCSIFFKVIKVNLTRIKI